MIAMLVGFLLCWKSVGNLDCCKMMAMLVGFPSMLETLSAVQ